MVSSLIVRTLKEGAVNRVELAGKLDNALPAHVREQVLALLKPGRQLVVGLSGLTAVSGQGFRMLLLLCRQARALGGTIVVDGASSELREFAECAGFGDLLRATTGTKTGSPIPVSLRRRIDAYPTHQVNGYSIRIGRPYPMGATSMEGGINFAIYSRHATAVTLVLFALDAATPVAEIPFPREFRIGDAYTMIVFDLDEDNIEYGFRIDGPCDPANGHRFDRTKVLLDPQARSVAGHESWGGPRNAAGSGVHRARLVPQDFDWGDDRPLELPLEDLVIYEMHVRGFTRSPTSGVRHAGTFAGLREKIPYLKKLGINCVELLPIFEFDESDMVRASLIGAILANLLLTLGVSFLLGGIRYHDQHFNAVAARTYSTMMLLAAVSMGVPSAFSRYFAPDGTIRQEQLLNVGIAVVLLLAYGLYLWFSLKTHPAVFASVETGTDGHDDETQWSVARAVGTLVGASALAAWMSEILVGAAEGTGKALGMSQTFVGIVFLAIVGGAAEAGSAVAMARKNKVDLTIGIALGSSIQIALFVAPVLVLTSYFIAPQPLDLAFGRASVGALFLGVLLGTIVCGDGQSNWYKGVQLITVYAIIAMMFYFVPEL